MSLYIVRDVFLEYNEECGKICPIDFVLIIAKNKNIYGRNFLDMKDDKIFAQMIIDRIKSKFKDKGIEIDIDLGESKKYEAFKIPKRDTVQDKNINLFSLSKENENNISLNEDIFAEIEINSNNTSYMGSEVPNLVLKVEKEEQEEVKRDEKRELFLAMRDIARANNSSYFLNTKFYSKQVQHENSKVFYKQAQFMKDFEDDYDKVVPFSSYFPYYQSMNYEQLRTYFTWRTKVRQGNVEKTPLSYAFLYIYELINNIGVDNPVEGLNKLMFFWENFKKYDTAINNYMLKWVKDYHIYYELPDSFKKFIIKYKLENKYYKEYIYEPEDNYSFDKLDKISKYNIKKSSFYSEDTKDLIKECYDFVINKIKGILAKSGLELDGFIFQYSKNISEWIPFEGALFYKHLKQANRQIIITRDEIYTYNQNRCFRSAYVLKDSGRQLITYIIKRMEIILRKLKNYNKFKISANLSMINTETLLKLGALGISIEKVVSDATVEFYSEKNKTIVSVDESSLNKIRMESLEVQEKLIIPENDLEQFSVFSDKFDKSEVKASSIMTEIKNEVTKEKESLEILNIDKLDRIEEKLDFPIIGQSFENDIWIRFKNSLNETELKALNIIFKNDVDIKRFVDEKGLMIEVLIDSINEKAFDNIGDNILEFDENIIIYEEYKEQVFAILDL